MQISRRRKLFLLVVVLVMWLEVLVGAECIYGDETILGARGQASEMEMEAYPGPQVVPLTVVSLPCFIVSIF